MTINGPEIKKVPAALTNEYICARLVCTDAIRILQEGDTQYSLIAENMCFYSEPKQERL